MAKILVVDDEQSIREFFDIWLSREGYEVTCVDSADKALNKISENIYDLVVTDIAMPGKSGLELLAEMKETSPETSVIMITAYASTESAVEAMKNGAYDYIMKPFKLEEIKLIIKKALEQSYLTKENALLKKQVMGRYAFGKLIGKSSEMLKVYELIEAVSGSRSSILITGESGTGKELVAKAIHYNSQRKEGPFVSINCGAIPENLIESELFGYVKGSFTGASSNKKGLFEIADKGTFFMDEVGELPLHVQVKLLRALQDKSIRRIGGTDNIEVDARIISATNKDIESEVKESRFREDLFYRLNVIQIKLPPLRERKDDIPILVYHFLNHYAHEHGKVLKGISREALDMLVAYDYPGNVRELENIVERAVALESGDLIGQQSIAINGQGTLGSKAASVNGGISNGPGRTEESIDLDGELAKVERNLILEALRRAKGSKQRASKLLNLSFRSLRYRMAKLGLDKEYPLNWREEEPDANGNEYRQVIKK